MLTRVAFGAVVCIAGITLADANEDVLNAVNKLNDTANYSWKTTSENAGGGGGPGGFSQEGKTEKNGYTLLNLTFGDNTVQVIMKGSKGVIKTDDGWKTAEEAADDQGPARFLSRMIPTFKTPGQMAADMSAKLKDFKQQEDVYVTEVTGKDATDLLTMGFRGRRGGGGNNAQPPQVSNAKAQVKVWIKDGAVSKTQMHVSGTVTRPDGNDMDIDRVTTTEFSDVGSTKVDVPDDAKKKLGE